MRDYLFFGSLGLLYIFVVIMVTLHSRCGHYIFVLWFLLLLSFYFFLVCSQPSQIGCLPYFHTWCGLSANVGCRSETYCMRLAENTGRKRLPKIRDLRTIAQLCWAISLQQCTYQQSEKNLLNSNISPTHPEIGWDRFLVWGTPAFQRVLRLGSVTAWHSSSGRQPNFAAMNRVRHVYSAGRPSRLALAHILVSVCFRCVRYVFFSTMPRDWLGRTTLKWPIFVWSGT